MAIFPNGFAHLNPPSNSALCHVSLQSLAFIILRHVSARPLKGLMWSGPFYRDGGDWTSGKIAMRSPRTEPSQSSFAT